MLIDSLNIRIQRLHAYQVYYDTSRKNHESLKKIRGSKSQVLGSSLEMTDNVQTIDNKNTNMRIETDYSPMNQTYKGHNKYKQIKTPNEGSRPRSVKMSSMASSRVMNFNN